MPMCLRLPKIVKCRDHASTSHGVHILALPVADPLAKTASSCRKLARAGALRAIASHRALRLVHRSVLCVAAVDHCHAQHAAHKKEPLLHVQRLFPLFLPARGTSYRLVFSDARARWMTCSSGRCRGRRGCISARVVQLWRLSLQALPVHLPDPIEHMRGNERNECYTLHAAQLLSRSSPRHIIVSRSAQRVLRLQPVIKALPSQPRHTACSMRSLSLAPASRMRKPPVGFKPPAGAQIRERSAKSSAYMCSPCGPIPCHRRGTASLLEAAHECSRLAVVCPSSASRSGVPDKHLFASSTTGRRPLSPDEMAQLAIHPPLAGAQQ